ncbi:hypothetical protein P9112_001989 [Eukaryota sp. TZLM1-RC]
MWKSCESLWNRDRNASLNMLAVMKAHAKGGDRPVYLQRAKVDEGSKKAFILLLKTISVVMTLECSICVSAFSDSNVPLIVCTEGHTCCLQCCKKLDSCPLCRSRLLSSPIVNRQLLDVISTHSQSSTLSLFLHNPFPSQAIVKTSLSALPHTIAPNSLSQIKIQSTNIHHDRDFINIEFALLCQPIDDSLIEATWTRLSSPFVFNQSNKIEANSVIRLCCPFSNVTLAISFGHDSLQCSILTNCHALTVPNLDGEISTPCLFSLYKNKVSVGSQLKGKGHLKSIDHVVSVVKHLIGKNPKEVSDWVRHGCQGLSVGYLKREQERKRVGVCIEDQEISFEEILGFLFGYLKAGAEKFSGQSFSDAVVSIPSYFGPNQRSAILQSSKLAGFNGFQLVEDSISSVFSHLVKNSISLFCNFLVVDFGVSFDCSVVEVSNQSTRIVSFSNDLSLTKDIRHHLFEYCLSRLARDYPATDFNNTSLRFKNSLNSAIESVLMDFDNSVDPELVIPSFSGKDPLVVVLSGDFITELLNPFMSRAMRTIERTMFEASLFNYDYVLVTGRVSRFSLFKKHLDTKFGSISDNIIFMPHDVVVQGSLFAKFFHHNTIAQPLTLFSNKKDCIASHGEALPLTRNFYFTANEPFSEVKLVIPNIGSLTVLVKDSAEFGVEFRVSDQGLSIKSVYDGAGLALDYTTNFGSLSDEKMELIQGKISLWFDQLF